MDQQMNGTVASEKSSLMSKLDKFKISGIGLPLYVIMAVILLLMINLHALPNNMLGAILVLVLLGHLFYYIGANLPIFKTYLGGGSVFTIFAAAALVTYGIIPHSVVQISKTFVNNMDFLDFYIVSLIVGSILGMNRKLLLRAAVRFLPVALISMAVTLIAVGGVGMLLGQGFAHSIYYVSIPIMAGGVGAGIVPLSGIYGHAFGQPASHILSQLFPATTFGNLLAIVGAGMLSKVFQGSKIDGNGVLMPVSDDMLQKKKAPLDVTRIGVGLVIAMAFFMVGTLLNLLVPAINSYAFIILSVIAVKGLGLLPEYYEQSVVMFSDLVVNNMTHALLCGVGMSLLDLKVLAASLSWQFVVLCLTSVIVISLVSGFIGKLFGMYPLEATITAGLCNNSMGGTGNVSVLAASNRMNLIAFAQMGNRLGGAIMLVVAGLLVSFMH
ncbi:2-hydroxycarboxylate transporter family protein [Periweissella fabalis]|nr:2-hydroxycarboxylate transporter family protein [Periweissella fabalis]